MNGLLDTFSGNGDCLSEEQLKLYLQQKLSASEQYQIENHLIDCELCTDALEGLRLVENPIELSNVVTELNQQIDIRVKSGEKKIIPFYTRFRIAAVITLVAISGGTFMYLQNQQKENEIIVAENQQSLPPAPTQDFKLKSAESDIKETADEISTTTTNTPAPIVKSNEAEIAKRIKQVDASASGTVAMEEKMVAPAAAYDDAKADNVTFINKEVEKKDAQTVATEPTSNQESIADKRKTEVATKANASNVLQKQLLNSELLLSNARVEMQNNSYESANYYLDQIINNNDSNYMEEALWNKALSLEKLNKSSDSKNILKRIVTLNGKYKKKAKEKLQE